MLALESASLLSVRLVCDGYPVDSLPNGLRVREDIGSVICTLEGYSGSMPSASVAVSSPYATTFVPTSPVRAAVYFVADGSGGGAWVVEVLVINDALCNVPTTAELTVMAGGVSYGVSIQIDDEDLTAPMVVDGWLVQCLHALTPTVSIVPATASESDGTATFVVRVSPPLFRAEGSQALAVAHDVQVDYSTAADSASDGSDYRAVSGTLTIPAGTGRATISVPLVDDSVAEGNEYFSLTLSNPVGAALSEFPELDILIVDDDTSVADPPAPASVCEGASLNGSVGDVFDVEQSGFAQWSDVFVDIELSCGGTPGAEVRHPTSVRVIHGSSGARRSLQCITRATAGRVGSIGTLSLRGTETTSVAGSCRTSAAYPPDVADVGHVLRVPDSAVGQDHQIRAWIDADRDGVHDGGEPYVTFESDFSSRTLTDSGSYEYEYPRDFEVRFADGSQTVSRGGHENELRLVLVEPMSSTVASHVGLPADETVYELAAGVPVGAPTLIAGPSRGQQVACLNTGRSTLRPPTDQSACITDEFGEIVVRYRVPTDAIDLFAMQQDLLRINIDDNGNGQLDVTAHRVAAEPAAYLQVPIAKAVNYVALGDSYSSGENGDEPVPGAYQAGKSPADGECRRWDQAYPYVFTREVLGNDELEIDVTFKTFACTGARTLNIYDPSDPRGDSLNETHAETNRPSPHAPEIRPIENLQTGVIELLPTSGWEPRQAVSLDRAQAELKQSMQNVDMITLTIGGNDIGFADVLTACVHPRELDGSCGADDLSLTFDQVEDRVVSTLDHLRTLAPKATIFIMGYPYLTPTITGCDAPSRKPGSKPGPSAFEYESERCEMEYNIIRSCGTLSASDVLGASLWGVGANVLSILNPVVTDGRINYAEANFLQASATALNSALRRAASRSRVHFVDVVSSVHKPGGLLNFAGHSPCEFSPWIHGYEAESGRQLDASSPKSFHPNAAGQQAYARILEQHILDSVSGAAPNEAGLPGNPERSGGSGHSARDGASSSSRPAGATDDAGGARGSATSSRSENLSQGATGESSSGETPEASAGFLDARRVASAGSACDAAFLAPGERVRLLVAGFAPAAAVSFSVRAVSLDGTELDVSPIPATTADADGAVDVSWKVPTAPVASVDAAPRGYMVDASGLNSDGGTHSAVMVWPLVAYPATAPCAVADTAATSLGRSIQIPAFANDVAPTGGSLDASSLWVQPASGGGFAVDSATGTVTFTPDAGFSGAVTTNYWVHDNWGVGVRGDITVTVSAGCTITGASGARTIEGTDGDDVICVPDPQDWRAFHVIDAKGGNDVILGGAGVEWVYGGAGADTIYGLGNADRIIAGPGVDSVYGGTGTDYIYSSDLEDTIVDDDYEMVFAAPAVAQSGPQTVDDWAWVAVSQTTSLDVLGNDHDPNDDLDAASLRITRLPTAGTAAVVTASDGRTVVDYSAAGTGGNDSFGYEVCDALGRCAVGEVTLMVGTTGCTIVGTATADTIYGTNGDDVICAGAGDDTVYGGGGNDIIIGGSGNDTLYGGTATPLLLGRSDGDDRIWGGPGNDTLYGGGGGDRIWGGAGNDTLYGGGATLVGTSDRGDSIQGGPGDDTIYGNNGNDLLWGGPGNDTVYGSGDDDRIWGGPGNDILSGDRSHDFLYGGPGDDTLKGGGENDTMWGGLGADTLEGGIGNDTLNGGAGNDRVFGGVGDDTLWGDNGNDRLRGGPGSDALHGGPGDDDLGGGDHNDILWGGPGDDTLDGGDHNDQLHGGPGDDRLRGGTGNDTLNGGNGTDYLDGGPDTDTCTRAQTTVGCEPQSRDP